MDIKILSLVVCLWVASALQVHTNLHMQFISQTKCFHANYPYYFMSIQYNGAPTLASACGADQKMTLNCQDSAQQRCTLFNGNKNTYIGFTDSSTNLKGISWQDQITYPQYDVWWAVQSMNPFLPPSVPNGLIFHNRDRNCYLDINYSSTVGIYSYQIACLTEDQGRSWY